MTRDELLDRLLEIVDDHRICDYRDGECRGMEEANDLVDRYEAEKEEE